MGSLEIVPRAEFSECRVCQKPLGAESKEQGFTVCHEHRKCSACGHDLSPREIKWCVDRFEEDLKKEGAAEYEIVHPRCSVLSPAHEVLNDPTITIKQSEYDYLNMIRLMVVPNPELSITTNENNAMIGSTRLIENMDFEARYTHLKMMEACVAQLSILRSRKDLKEQIDTREKKRLEKARKEADTSSRPVSSDAEVPKELAIAEFMKNFGIASRKVAIKLQSQRDKTAKSFEQFGISATDAKAQADKMLLDNIKSGKQIITE